MQVERSIDLNVISQRSAGHYFLVEDLWKK